MRYFLAVMYTGRPVRGPTHGPQARTVRGPAHRKSAEKKKKKCREIPTAGPARGPIFEFLCGPVKKKIFSQVITQIHVVSHTILSSCFRFLFLLLAPKCLHICRQ